MYTFHKDHLTWQQAVGHEVRDRFDFRARNDEKMYDLDRNENYLKRLEEIRMKRFYGKHLHKYMGDTQPRLEKHETGVGRTFAPLATTSYGKGFRSASAAAPAAKTNENDILLKKLETLGKKVETSSRMGDGIFKQIAQKTMDREQKV